MVQNPDQRALKKEQAGQGLVEFALILPLMLLLMWGIIEFGRLLVVYTEVSNAAREAVRYGVAHGTDIASDPRYLDCEGIRDAGKAVTAITLLEDDNFAIAYDRGGGGIFDTCPPSTQVGFGNRLIITVTQQIRPLILFQDAGPFQVQFSSARTIVQQGIAMSGFDYGSGEGGGGGGGPSPPGSNPMLTFTLDVTTTCEGHFNWTSEADSDGYRLYRTVPTPTVQIGDNITATLFYPASGSMSVVNGQGYYVRAYNGAGPGPTSNIVTIIGCGAVPDAPANLSADLVQPDPCQASFTWDTVDGADGYHLYEATAGQINGDISAPPYTANINNGDYTIRAYNGFGESFNSGSVTVSGCAIDPPTSLAFVLDRATPPCQGHFTWDPVGGVDGYRLYETTGGLIGEVSDARYPSGSGGVNTLDGQQYVVKAYSGATESAPSNMVIVDGCYDITYYLHTSSVLCNDHQGDPPLTMDEDEPVCSGLYDYNGGGGSLGREVTKNGPMPPPATGDEEKYLAWYTEQLPERMLIQSDVTLYLWGKNPENQDYTANIYLYSYDGSSYTQLDTAVASWLAHTDDWLLKEVTFNVAGRTVEANHQLVVGLKHSNAQKLYFAYDTKTDYKSRIEFIGVPN